MQITRKILKIDTQFRFTDGFESGRHKGKHFKVIEEVAFFKIDGRDAVSFWAREIYPSTKKQKRPFYMWTYLDENPIAEIVEGVGK